MTSQYVTEPPTHGKILLVTSKGDIEVELFAKETPKACRNILTLALEGFYDRQIFHRLIPGFIIQTGDPSGTGMGGESIYGEPFPTEPHSRLKFNRRGLVAMAAEEGVNESQFFITLDATPELQGKHTLFGRVVGNTIYNVLALAECEMDKQNPDRPRYPPKLLEIKVLENPFDDLQPRTTKEERRTQERARKEEEQKRLKEASKRKNKKNTTLLSFGDEEDAQGETLKGPKSSHDLLKDDKKLSKQSALATSEISTSETEPAKKRRKEGDEQTQRHDASPSPSIGGAHPSTTLSSSAEPSSSRTMNGTGAHHEPSTSGLTTSSGADAMVSKKKESRSERSAKEFLSETRHRYAKAKKDKSDAYDALLSFQTRMRASASLSESSRREAVQINGVRGDGPNEEEEEAGAKEYGASDDDSDWRNHTFDAGGKPLLGNDTYSVEDYEVLDPRQHTKNTETSNQDRERDRERGKRGRDWVEQRTYRDAHTDSRHRSHRDRDRPTRDHERRDRRDYADDRLPQPRRRDQSRR